MPRPRKRKAKPRARRRGPSKLPAGAPPPSPMLIVPQGDPISAEVLALGAPPTDRMQSQGWSYDLMIAQMAEAAFDPRLTASARRREVRAIAAAAATLLPRASIAAAVKMIQADAAKLDGRARARKGAVLEPAPPAKVIPIAAAADETATSAGD